MIKSLIILPMDNRKYFLKNFLLLNKNELVSLLLVMV